MQALFYIGLFGTFFFVASSLTVGLSLSTMQEQVNQRKEVAQMFDDAAHAINTIVLRQSPSLELHLGEFTPLQGLVADADLSFVGGVVSWSPQELATDPWRSPIRVVRIREEEILDASGVFADVSYFVLASPGVDRSFQTTFPTTLTEWRVLHASGGDPDDIIHTFSTKDAAIETWNRASQVELQIAQTALSNYRQQVEQFNRSNNSVLEDFTACALFGVTDANTLVGIDCSPFTDTLIQECFAVHQYNTPPEGAPPPLEPPLVFLPEIDIPVNLCWRYEPVLQGGDAFPVMAGSMALYTNPDDAGIAAALGVGPLLASDPFNVAAIPSGNLTFEVGASPNQLILRRGAFVSVPGWRFSGRQTLISAE